MLGLPEAPIVIEPFLAGQKWNGGQFNAPGGRLEYVTLDGSQQGIINGGSSNAIYYIDNSILRNHDTAINVFGYLQGTLFSG